MKKWHQLNDVSDLDGWWYEDVENLIWELQVEIDEYTEGKYTWGYQTLCESLVIAKRKLKMLRQSFQDEEAEEYIACLEFAGWL